MNTEMELRQLKAEFAAMNNKVRYLFSDTGSGLTLAQVTVKNSSGTVNVDLYENGTFDLDGNAIEKTKSITDVIPEDFTNTPEVGTYLAVTKKGGNYYAFNAPTVAGGIVGDFFCDLFDRSDSAELNGYWGGRLQDFSITSGALKTVNAYTTYAPVGTNISVNKKDYIIKMGCVVPPLPSVDSNSYQPAGVTQSFRIIFGGDFNYIKGAYPVYKAAPFQISIAKNAPIDSASLAAIAKAQDDLAAVNAAHIDTSKVAFQVNVNFQTANNTASLNAIANATNTKNNAIASAASARDSAIASAASARDSAYAATAEANAADKANALAAMNAAEAAFLATVAVLAGLEPAMYAECARLGVPSTSATRIDFPENAIIQSYWNANDASWAARAEFGSASSRYANAGNVASNADANAAYSAAVAAANATYSEAVAAANATYSEAVAAANATYKQAVSNLAQGLKGSLTISLYSGATLKQLAPNVQVNGSNYTMLSETVPVDPQLKITVSGNTITATFGSVSISYSDASVIKNCKQIALAASPATAQASSIKAYATQVSGDGNTVTTEITDSGYGKFYTTRQADIDKANQVATDATTKLDADIEVKVEQENAKRTAIQQAKTDAINAANQIEDLTRRQSAIDAANQKANDALNALQTQINKRIESDNKKREAITTTKTKALNKANLMPNVLYQDKYHTPTKDDDGNLTGYTYNPNAE